MSEAAARIVRQWFDRMQKGDLGLDLAHPDIEIRNWDEMPNSGPYHGREGMRRWWADTEDAFEDLRWELLELIDLGDDRVLTLQRTSGRFRRTGIEMSVDWGSVNTVRDGLIASAHGYPSVRRARRAAGLAPEAGEEPRPPH